jgi:formamidopyrimidine-DNA glycosylase
MPELPEVDSYRTGLAPTMTGWKIKGGKTIWKNASNANYSSIVNQKITGFDRRGKYLIINLEKSNIIIHLRMTGRIDLTEGETPKYTTVEFNFHNNKKMCLVDYRKFGKVWIVEDVENIVRHLGIEPLSKLFTNKQFELMIKKRTGTLKPLLLNQRFIAGIGNYLADEILFKCSLHPLRKADTLNKKEIRGLYISIKHIIRKSISFGGTTFLTFRGPEGKKGEFWKKLQVFRKTGEPCPHCKRPITRIIVGQRSTHLCENKQKLHKKLH